MTGISLHEYDRCAVFMCFSFCFRWSQESQWEQLPIGMVENYWPKSEWFRRTHKWWNFRRLEGMEYDYNYDIWPTPMSEHRELNMSKPKWKEWHSILIILSAKQKRPPAWHNEDGMGSNRCNGLLNARVKAPKSQKDLRGCLGLRLCVV